MGCGIFYPAVRRWRSIKSTMRRTTYSDAWSAFIGLPPLCLSKTPTSVSEMTWKSRLYAPTPRVAHRMRPVSWKRSVCVREANKSGWFIEIRTALSPIWLYEPVSSIVANASTASFRLSSSRFQNSGLSDCMRSAAASLRRSASFSVASDSLISCCFFFIHSGIWLLLGMQSASPKSYADHLCSSWRCQRSCADETARYRSSSTRLALQTGRAERWRRGWSRRVRGDLRWRHPCDA